MFFYTVIFSTILFLIIATFLQVKLPDPNDLIQNYDFLELVVSDTTDKQLTNIFILETFPFVMFIFKIVSMIHLNEFHFEHTFDIWWLGFITFFYIITLV